MVDTAVSHFHIIDGFLGVYLLSLIDLPHPSHSQNATL